MKTIFTYEFLLIFRSKVFITLLCCLLVLTSYSLFNGRNYYDKQQTIITEVQIKQTSAIQEAIANLSADTLTEEGKRKYINASKASWSIFGQKCYVYWPPDALSVLCIGNRDIYPYYQEILPVSLYMRLFKNEINNPVLLLTGNIDFSYVMIMLLPLLIIAVTFDLVSSDRESNVAPLLYLTVQNKFKHYLFRYLFYAALFTVILAVLFLLALLFIPSGYDRSALTLLFAYTAGYSLFWLLISYGITILDNSSTTNVSVLVSVWLTLTILIPSFSNQRAIELYPISTEEISHTIRRVQLEDKAEVFQAVLHTFYRKYPQYLQQDTAYSILFDKAYLAQGQLNDEKGDSLLNTMIQTMKAKEKSISRVAYIDPSMLLQQQFCNNAKSNLNDYIAYLRSVQEYNTALKLFYFQRAFGTNKITKNDYLYKMPRF